MEKFFYVVYDENDNILYCLHTKIELMNLTGLLSRNINYRFKNNDFINVFINKELCKIYRFS